MNVMTAICLAGSFLSLVGALQAYNTGLNYYPWLIASIWAGIAALGSTNGR